MGLKKCEECGAQISTSTDKCPQCGKAQTKRSTLVIGGLFAVAIAAVVLVDREPATTGGGEREPSAAQVTRENVDLDYSWARDSDGALHVEMTIENANDFSVRDLLIACTTYAASNARLDRLEYTIHEVLPAGHAAEYTGVMGVADRQTERTSCRVVDVRT
ncbi:zinc ribbon domain-containing protein [Thioalkalivibrio sp. ALJ8]|uniref:zinc ribbon domain-containing protein n=1 Tax=Thioalkalivibrio sp. ALJ8 TaxID=1158757 RepID=UPI0003814D59|nr:zinc ribbon domain-containing protein [Thioalkalivibrio sp. ALJ8]